MTNYKEQTVTGSMSKWRRAETINIQNTYNTIPSLQINEVEQTLLPDGSTTKKNVATLKENFKNPMEQFNLLNPETNEVLGTVYYRDIYVMLYSLYIHLANKRDEGTLPDN